MYIHGVSTAGYIIGGKCNVGPEHSMALLPCAHRKTYLGQESKRLAFLGTMGEELKAPEASQHHSTMV